MKLGYKKLIVFITFLLTIFFMDILWFHKFSLYTMIIFLCILLLFFKYCFIFEKVRIRFERRIILEIITLLLLFFIMYYGLGIIIGLTKSANYMTWDGLKTIIFPMFIYIILREIFRYNLMMKAGNKNLCIVLTVLLFIVMDLACNLTYNEFNSKYDVLRFVTITFIPIISKNIAYSYVIKSIGYKPIILFDGVFVLYPYILPFVPNASEYLISIIKLILPAILPLRFERFFAMKIKSSIHGSYYKKTFNDYFIPITLVCILLYFFSGYFRYYAIAVASDSMNPTLAVGDLIIVDQKNPNLKVDDIIAFKKDNKIMVHRINQINNINNVYFYYTKGDNNENIDDFIVDSNMIIGKVKMKIPYIGYPTVLVNKG